MWHPVLYLSQAHSLGLPLDLEAHVMTPNGVICLFLSFTGTGIYALSAPEAAERQAFFDGITQQLAQAPRANLNRQRKAVAPPQVRTGHANAWWRPSSSLPVFLKGSMAQPPSVCVLFAAIRHRSTTDLT